MATINKKDFQKQIRSREFSNAYFIYGDDSYYKQTLVEELKKKVVGDFADFNFHQYDGQNALLDEILKDAEIFPMFDEYTFILVHDFKFSLSNDVKDITEFLKQIPASTIVAFWFDTIEVNTKEAKWKKLVSAFSKYGSAVEINKPTYSELIKTVIKSFSKLGATISYDNAEYLVSVVGDDLNTIFNEIRKIASYTDGGEVKRESIDSLATKTLQAKIFDLSRQVAKGDTFSAIENLNALYEAKEDPVKIFGIFSSNFVDMQRIKSAKAAAQNAYLLEDYFPSYRYGKKYTSFKIKNAMRDADKISQQSLNKMIDILSDVDLKIKTTQLDSSIILEEAVIKLSLIARGQL